MEQVETIAVVQARTSSSRLPSKVLLTLAGNAVIVGILKRVSLSTRINKVILATSNDASDDELARLVEHHGFDVVRGPLDDVLSRFNKALELYPAKYCVRITGDCPFIDPDWIDLVIEKHMKVHADYSTNALQPSLPDGLDCEVINVEILKSIADLTRNKTDREHVTHYLYTHPDEYKINSIVNDIDYSNIRITLDNPEDWQVISRIVEGIEKDYLDIRLQDIINFLQVNPEIMGINSDIKRNEGLKVT